MLLPQIATVASALTSSLPPPPQAAAEPPSNADKILCPFTWQDITSCALIESISLSSYIQLAAQCAHHPAGNDACGRCVCGHFASEASLGFDEAWLREAMYINVDDVLEEEGEREGVVRLRGAELLEWVMTDRRELDVPRVMLKKKREKGGKGWMGGMGWWWSVINWVMLRRPLKAPNMKLMQEKAEVGSVRVSILSWIIDIALLVLIVRYTFLDHLQERNRKKIGINKNEKGTRTQHDRPQPHPHPCAAKEAVPADHQTAEAASPNPSTNRTHVDDTTVGEKAEEEHQQEQERSSVGMGMGAGARDLQSAIAFVEMMTPPRRRRRNDVDEAVRRFRDLYG